MDKKAWIFDIERFATKDGPGCRTVVFFKGCNMHCRWCHNPESISMKPQLLYNEVNCVICGKCAEACKTTAHVFDQNLHVFYEDRCSSCLSCTKTCYSGALKQVGKEMMLDEIMAEIEQDVTLYQKSGGGVTLSGGEVMLQADFVQALLTECKTKNISTCIETNLSVPWEQYEKILPMLDFLFVDVKHIDSSLHKKWTGLGNERIWDNLKKLDAYGKPFAVRTPIVPGVNDQEATIKSIAEYLRPMRGLQYYELLGYHPLGQSKGRVICGSQETITVFPVPSKELLYHLARGAAGFVPTKLEGKWVNK